MDPEVPSESSALPVTEPLSQEEFLTLFTIDYLRYYTPQEVAKINNMDTELCTMIFMKLEDLGFIKIEMKDNKIHSAIATEQGKTALEEDRYLDYVPE